MFHCSYMRLLSHDMKLSATLPDGTETVLIDANGDFNWQESYQFAELLALPKGTVLKIAAHYDNSANNPFNPNSPLRTVGWGEQTTDEMCIAFLEIAPSREAQSEKDLKRTNPRDLIRDALTARLRDKLTHGTPRNAVTHRLVGSGLNYRDQTDYRPPRPRPPPGKPPPGEPPFPNGEPPPPGLP